MTNWSRGVERSEAAALLKGSALTGAALAWFLLFPSMGVAQKYLGTTAAFVYFGVGSLFLAALGRRGSATASQLETMNGRWPQVALAGLFLALVLAFAVLYPVASARVESSTASATRGSDRDESLMLGIQELLAGHYPYHKRTPLQNSVTQLPGSLLLATPFALLGNAAWQNLFWLAAFFAISRYLFGDRLALGFIVITVVLSPVVLQDFVTGGDLGASVIAILAGTLLTVELVPNPSIALWKKVGVAAFTGIALSSRLNCMLLLPVLFAALARRADLRSAAAFLCVIGVVFTAVTLPFYWHDPPGFAPLSLHNKFRQFEGEVRNAGLIFPALSLLFSVIVSAYPGNRAVRVWLIQSGLVLTLPVVFLVALATVRTHAPNFVFTDYALAGVFFGGIGAALTVFRQEPEQPTTGALDPRGILRP